MQIVYLFYNVQLYIINPKNVFLFFLKFLFNYLYVKTLFNSEIKKFILDSLIPLYATSSSTACPESLGKEVYLHQGRPTTLSCQPLK